MALQTLPTLKKTDDEPTIKKEKKAKSWIARFLELEQHSLFCRISDSYLSDNFELYELDDVVKNYQLALNLLRGRRKESFEHLTIGQKKVIENNATILYGLIHARYIITKRGLEKMKRKYINNDFGLCCRNNCNEQSLLPTALTDEKGKECVRLYCSNCNDIYLPDQEYFKHIDGAYFGTTFAHFFLLTFPIFKPRQTIIAPKYTPKMFGFRMHKTWHNIALKEWNEKHYINNENNNINKVDEKMEMKQDNINQFANINNNDEVQVKMNYLMQIKEKQTEEIMRLQAVIQTKQKEMNERKSLHNKQAIQLLSLQTKVDLYQQRSMNTNALLSAPIPSTTLAVKTPNDDDQKELDGYKENGFEDILKRLNEKVIVVKNQREIHGISNKDLKTFEKQLDEIWKISQSLKLYLKMSLNGI